MLNCTSAGASVDPIFLAAIVQVSGEDCGGLDLDEKVGLAEATTPISVMGFIMSMSAEAAARNAPSPSAAIFSGDQSTTYTVSFAMSAKLPPAASTAMETLRIACSVWAARSPAPTALPSASAPR